MSSNLRLFQTDFKMTGSTLKMNMLVSEWAILLIERDFLE